MNKLIGALVGIVFLAGVTALGGSFYTVDSGERGVITRFGKVVDMAQPGLGFKTPFITSVYTIDVQPQTIKDELNSYSSDMQLGDIQVSVTIAIKPDKVADLFAQFYSLDNYKKRIVAPRLAQEGKAVFGHFTALEATNARDKLAMDIQKALEPALAEFSNVQSVQVENVKFDPKFDQALLARKTAEIAVETQKQAALEAQVKAQIVVTNAKADADKVILNGEAEARAIKARSDALKESPNLVALTAAEKWDGKLPATMVPGSAVPFLPIK
jgi:regulator of protease activity HflC (stomatin/prohibitin superfamily)